MCKLRLFDYQQEVVDSKEEEIICNWSRNLGKDYTLLCKILKDKPNRVLWVGDFCLIGDKISEILNFSNLKDSMKLLYISKDNIRIKHPYSPRVINIRKYTGEYDKEEVDLIVFNNILPYKIKNIKSKQIISMISINNCDRKLQKLFPNLKIREQGKDTLLKHQLVPESILELMKEDSSSKYYNEFDILSNPQGITKYEQKK